MIHFSFFYPLITGVQMDDDSEIVMCDHCERHGDGFKEMLGNMLMVYLRAIDREVQGLPAKFHVKASVNLAGSHMCTTLVTTMEKARFDIIQAFQHKHYRKYGPGHLHSSLSNGGLNICFDIKAWDSS